MAKFLNILSVALLGMASVQAHEVMKDHMMMSKEDMINLAHKLEGKTVTMKASEVKEWFRHCAQALELKAHALNDMGKQFGEKIAHQYKKAARHAKNLAGTLSTLPVPKDVKKTFTHVPEWFALKAEKMRLKSMKLQSIAHQLNMPMLTKKAEWLKAKSQEMKEVAQELSKSEEMKEEKTEECGVTGADYQEADYSGDYQEADYQ